MSIWNLLEQILRESKQYRGDTAVTFKALTELIHGKGEKPGILGRPPKVEGEVFNCKYQFNPSIWGKWFSSMEPAVTIASTGGNQHHGASQGYTTMKMNYGGRVVHAPGKAKGDFERLPSSMDTYDVLMQAEVTSETIPDMKTKKMKTVSNGVLLRMAYSPSVGRTEERAARLQAMMAGQDPGTLSRRPQPNRPNPTTADLKKWSDERVKALGKQQSMAHADNIERVKRERWGQENDERKKQGLPPLPPPADLDLEPGNED